MQDINSVVFTARLTADPELHSTRSGRSVSRLRVAIQRRNGREGEDRGAAFYDVEVWNGLAETCARNLAKGRRIAVEGRLEHQEWTDDHDQPRQRCYVVADQVNFLDPPQGRGEAKPAEAEPVSQPA